MRESGVLVLVQTRGVLSRPYCLIELVTAIDAGRPIVGVTVGSSGAGSAGYDFGASVELLLHLDSLLEDLNPGAAAVLAEHGVELIEAAHKLSLVVPKIISIHLDAYSSRHHIAATMQQLVEAIRHARPLPLSTSQAAWLASRPPPPTSLAAASAVAQHGSRQAATAARGARVPRQVPALPPSFTDTSSAHGSTRSVLLGSLKAAVLKASPDQSDATLRKVLLRGMGGIGKSAQAGLLPAPLSQTEPGPITGGGSVRLSVACSNLPVAATLAAAVARDAAVLQRFDSVAWLTLGQTPDIDTMLRSLASQLSVGSSAGANVTAGGAPPPTTLPAPPRHSSPPSPATRCPASPGGKGHGSSQTTALFDEAARAAQGRSVLLVIDDAWDADAHVHTLCPLDEFSDSACLVTSRVKSLVPGATEVAVDVLTQDEACTLLLSTGEVAHTPGQPWPKAALDVADLCGQLPLALSIAGAMLRELADDWETSLLPALKAGHGSEASSIEGRVIVASLNCIAEEARAGVLALFEVLATFPEDTTLPIAVVDALAALVLCEAERAGAAGGGAAADAGRPSPRECLQVRKLCLELLRLSLLSGSIARGLGLHDVVRDFAIARARARPGGLAALQRRVAVALASASPGSGPTFQDLATETDASNCRGSELDFYVSHHLGHHVRQCLVVHADGEAADPTLALWLCSHADRTVRRGAAQGLGAGWMRRAAEAAEVGERFREAAWFWLNLSNLAMDEDNYSTATVEARERAHTMALKLDDMEATRDLELEVLPLLALHSLTPQKKGAYIQRILAVTAGVDEQLQSVDVLNCRRLASFTQMMMREATPPYTVEVRRQAEAHRCENHRIAMLCARRSEDGSAGQVYYETMGLLGQMVVWGRLRPPEFDAHRYCGTRGEAIHSLAAKYDFGKHHGWFKSIGLKNDANLFGVDAPVLLAAYGDVAGFKKLHDRCVGRWEQVFSRLSAEDGGGGSGGGGGAGVAAAADGSSVQAMSYRIEWNAYLMVSRAGHFLLRDWQGIAASYARVPDHLGDGDHEAPLIQAGAMEAGGSAFTPPSMLVALKALSLLVGVTKQPAERTATWMPTVEQLLAIPEAEPQWDMMMVGGMHVCSVCARAMAECLGEWDKAAEVASGLLYRSEAPLLNTLTRLELMLLLAEAKQRANGLAEAAALLDDVGREACACKLVLVEWMAAAQKLALGPGWGNEGALEQIVSRMVATAEELRPYRPTCPAYRAAHDE